jgi:large subunit ribosomal protein L10
MNRKAKEEKIKELRDRLQQAGAVILTDYRGLNVEEISRLRQELKNIQTQYLVAKNTLIRLASPNTDLELVKDLLLGPTALALCFGDPVALVKTIRNFSKDNPQLEIKGGVLPGRALELSEIEVLAGLESRDALLSRLLNSLIFTLRKALAILSAPQRNLVLVLHAIQGKK